MDRRPLLACAAGSLVVVAAGSAGAGTIGPDVIYSDCTATTNWGAVGGIRAYSLGSNTCNIGDMNLLWGSSHNGTPVLGMNAYRLQGGRLVQIGQSWAKNGTGAGASPGCGVPCNGQGGSVLGVGCMDVYSSGFNGIQSILQRRSLINAFTGQMTIASPGGSTAIERRLQIQESDLDALLFPGALYFVEGVYVGTDDAQWGNALNNASYKRVTVGAGLALNVTGAMNVGMPAINAWRDHGNGVNTPDPGVAIVNVDVPGEGRFVAASKVTDAGGGTWHYEYAVFNLNSHRSAGSLRIPFPAGTVVGGIGFHDVDYHSGEVYDNTDWSITLGGTSVSWANPQTWSENPDGNALRWGTMYNFWFDANRPPAPGTATLGLFIPGTEPSASLPWPVPASPPCPWDIDGSGGVDIADLLQLLSGWGPNPGHPADFDGDGDVDVADLLDLLSHWGSCP